MMILYHDYVQSLHSSPLKSITYERVDSQEGGELEPNVGVEAHPMVRADARSVAMPLEVVYLARVEVGHQLVQDRLRYDQGHSLQYQGLQSALLVLNHSHPHPQ